MRSGLLNGKGEKRREKKEQEWIGGGGRGGGVEGKGRGAISKNTYVVLSINFQRKRLVACMIAFQPSIEACVLGQYGDKPWPHLLQE